MTEKKDKESDGVSHETTRRVFLKYSGISMLGAASGFKILRCSPDIECDPGVNSLFSSIDTERKYHLPSDGSRRVIDISLNTCQCYYSAQGLPTMTPEALAEGRLSNIDDLSAAPVFFGGHLFLYVRKYLQDCHDPSYTDDPMQGCVQSISGEYASPGKATGGGARPIWRQISIQGCSGRNGIRASVRNQDSGRRRVVFRQFDSLKKGRLRMACRVHRSLLLFRRKRIGKPNVPGKAVGPHGKEKGAFTGFEKGPLRKIGIATSRKKYRKVA